jgi:hypothetical protein
MFFWQKWAHAVADTSHGLNFSGCFLGSSPLGVHPAFPPFLAGSGGGLICGGFGGPICFVLEYFQRLILYTL